MIKEIANENDTAVIIVDANLYFRAIVKVGICDPLNSDVALIENRWNFDNDSDGFNKNQGDCNYSTYGVLYNYKRELDVCPSGWHLPSDDDWKILESYLGMDQDEVDDTYYRGTDEGGELKETGTTHWTSPNAGATNSIGFTALPGGKCSKWGYFISMGDYGLWWSSSEYDSTRAWQRTLYRNFSDIYRDREVKSYGLSVRCVMD